MKTKLFSLLSISVFVFASCVDLDNDNEVRWPADVKTEIVLERHVNSGDSLKTICTLLYIDKYNYIACPEYGTVKINNTFLDKINITGSSSYFFQKSSPSLLLPDSTYSIQMTMDDGNAFFASVKTVSVEIDSLIAPANHNSTDTLVFRWYPADSLDNLELSIKYFNDSKYIVKNYEISKEEKTAGQKKLIPANFTGGYSKIELYLKKYNTGQVDSVFYAGSFIRAYHIRSKVIVLN